MADSFCCCPGDGACVEQCLCECEEDIDEDGYYEEGGPDPDGRSLAACVRLYPPGVWGDPGRLRCHRVYPCKLGCVPTKCPNFQMCRCAFPPAMSSCWKGRCMDCDVGIGENIVFSDPAACEDCPICMDGKANTKFPQCAHKICPACIRKYLLRPDRGEGLPRDLGGCPMCRAEKLPPAWSLAAGGVNGPRYVNGQFVGAPDMCGYEGCMKSGATQQCSRCKVMKYCSRECQRRHWKAGHREECCAASPENKRPKCGAPADEA